MMFSEPRLNSTFGNGLLRSLLRHSALVPCLEFCDRNRLDPRRSTLLLSSKYSEGNRSQ